MGLKRKGRESTCTHLLHNRPLKRLKKNLFTRFLDTVEWLGNLLPHPITLFAMFCVAILVASGIAGYFEVSVVDPRPEGAAGRAADGMIHVVSLFNAEGYSLSWQT